VCAVAVRAAHGRRMHARPTTASPTQRLGRSATSATRWSSRTRHSSYKGPPAFDLGSGQRRTGSRWPA
jgi:hypothetical protein